VAKHGTGFSLWPTKAHDYSVRNSPWENGKGDVVRDFIASCKKYGIRPGIYASASANGYLYVDNPGLVQPGGPVTQQQYSRIVERQLTELWTNYGHLFEIWFDGGVIPVSKGGPVLAPLLKKLQPDAIVFQGPVGTKNLVRWIGNEDGVAPYPDWSTADTTTSATGTVKMDNLGGDPHGKAWVPGEADFPIRDGWQGGWFWKAHGQHLKTVEQLLQKYHTSVGRNANMLIGMVIDTTGRVPDEDVARYTAFGKALKEEFSHPVYTGTGEGALINIDLGPKPRELNCVVLSEDIAKGERVRSYVIEALVGDRWQTIARGTSIGHKHIEDIPTVTAGRLRIRVTGSVGKPQLSKIAVYKISPEYANNQR
jgi:alpha-L-fucosidase